MNAARPHRLLFCASVLAAMTVACGDDGDGGDVDAATTLDAASDVPDGDVGEDVAEADAADADAADAEPDAPAPLPEPRDWCDGAPPDAACFATRRAPESDRVALAIEIADKVLETHDPAELRWDWGEAVMLVGVNQVARVTGDERYRDFIAAYLDHHLEDGYTLETSDTSAPVALAVELIAAGRDEARYRDVVDEALSYYADDAQRTPEGGISHFGTVELFGAQLWADSLFMFGNVMTGWGEFADDAALLDAYVEQFAIFSELMQEGVGFFRHAEYASFQQDPDVYWARANGWILAAGYDHASVRIDRGERAPEVEASAAWLVDAVSGTQDADTGLWWTVLNRPGETYLETSASALFAFGLARAWRYHLVDDSALEVIDAAMEGVLARITRDDAERPVVTGISGPTSVGGFSYYAGVPVRDDISYGIGAVLLALTETSGMELLMENE